MLKNTERTWLDMGSMLKVNSQISGLPPQATLQQFLLSSAHKVVTYFQVSKILFPFHNTSLIAKSSLRCGSENFQRTWKYESCLTVFQDNSSEQLRDPLAGYNHISLSAQQNACPITKKYSNRNVYWARTDLLQGRTDLLQM